VVADLRGLSRPTVASVPDALVLVGETGEPGPGPMKPLAEGLGTRTGLIALIVALGPVEMAIKGGGTALAAVIVEHGAVKALKAPGMAQVEGTKSAVAIDPMETVTEVVEPSVLEAGVIKAAAEAIGLAILIRAAIHEVKPSGTAALGPDLRTCVPFLETAAETNVRGASRALIPARGPSTMAVPTGRRDMIPRPTGVGSLRLPEKQGSSSKDGGGDWEP